MNSIAKQVREIFPMMNRDEYIAWIKEIQEQLCPTCLENQEFNPEAECDCTKRPKYVSAEDIYDGNCDQEIADHWIEALIDAKGALMQIALFRNRPWDPERRKPYSCEEFRKAFTQACRDAQGLMGLGKTWEDLDPLSCGTELLIGMAYKSADEANFVYKDMVRLGRET